MSVRASDAEAAERAIEAQAPVPQPALALQAGAPATALLAAKARGGNLSAAGALRLQRTVGNRALRRLLARDDKDKRPMQDAKYPMDPRVEGWNGQQWVWDAFDNTATIFLPDNDPNNPGGAIQLVYGEGTVDALNKMPNSGMQNALGLSRVRASILEYLRSHEGTYQNESTEAFNQRVAIGATMCNAFTGALTTDVFQNSLGGMDPRANTVAAGRGGAFHTIWDRKEGPKPGDLVAYGKVEPAAKGSPRRRANFTAVTHVGFMKSRHATADGKEIWTVVDGGQNDPGGTKKNIVQERTRTFTLEDLDVQIPNRFATSDRIEGGKTYYLKGSPIGYENDRVTLTCGVLKSKHADAGQNADDKLLRGWVDVDEYYGGGPPPPLTGVNNAVFVGNDPQNNGAAKTGAVATPPPSVPAAT